MHMMIKQGGKRLRSLTEARKQSDFFAVFLCNIRTEDLLILGTQNYAAISMKRFEIGVCVSSVDKLL